MPPLGRMILRRLLWVFPVAFGVVTMTFFMARVLNGDPTELYAPPEATDALRAAIRARLGLADPLPVQFVHYLGDLLRFDLGTSFTTGQSVASDLWDRLPATLELGLVGLMLGIVVGIPLGVLAAVHREHWPDFVVRGTTLSGMALPQFWVGLVLISIFFVDLRWLPGPVGRLPIGIALPPKVTGFLLIDTLLAGKPELWWLALKQLALPALTLGFSTAAPIARVTRSAMAEAMQSDYIRTAIAMGTAAGGVVPLRPVQRLAAGCDADRRRCRSHLRGRGAVGIDLRLARAGAIRAAGDRALGLRGPPGFRHLRLAALCAGVPRGRSPLHVHRPAD